MKHAGLHWPNGPTDNEELASYPGSAFLMCSPEARWHYNWLKGRRPDAVVVWRGMPRPGKRPAELDYKAKRVAYECALHWDEQEHGGNEHFLPLNELNLNYERGDDEDDFADLEGRYLRLDLFLQALEPQLRRQLGPDVLLHYPAWAPGHYEWEHLDRWRKSASLYDVIHFHAYGSADDIEAEYRRYRAAFPGKPLFLGEWNTGVNAGGPDFHVLGIEEEERVLELLARLQAEDPLFLGATYFSYRWDHGFTREFDVEGDWDREVLFRNPPDLQSKPAPVTPPPPMLPPLINQNPEPETVYTRDDVVAISNVVADTKKIPRVLLLACALAESNADARARRPSDPSRDESYWPDVSGGAWQQTVRYDPEYTGGDAFPERAEITRIIKLQYDAWRSARVAADQLKRHLSNQVGDSGDDLTKYGDLDAAILATLYRYNWPGGRGKPYSDAHRRNYEDGLRRAKAELAALEDGEDPEPERPVAAFDREEPMPRQEEDWTCSAAALAWVLRSIGRDTTEDDAVALLGDGINPDDGLRYASGTELAGVLVGLGLKVTRVDPASFDTVAKLSQAGPIAMGGRDFYHWVGVRGYDRERDVLRIANSAPGHKDVYDTMDRAQFNRLGAFAAVAVELPGPQTEDPAVIEELKRRIAELEKERDGLVNVIGYLTGDVTEALVRASDDIEAKIDAAKAATSANLDAIVSTMKSHRAG